MGDLNALSSEIRHFDGDVILSSEDFESVVGHQERWQPLVSSTRSVDREIVLVIYVRNQVDYLESLFQEMLRQGFGDDYMSFVNAVLSNGYLRLHEWEFLFDYAAVADKLRMVPDFKVIFRNYHTLRERSPILDFAFIVGMDSMHFSQTASDRFNARDTLSASLTMFYRNRVGRSLDSGETKIIQLLTEQIRTKTNTTGALRGKLDQSFHRSNNEFCERFGLPKEGLVTEEEPVRHAREFSMQRAFSAETQSTIRDLSFLVIGDSDEVEASRLAAHLENWRSWVSG
jgi:hypothetical protein